MFIPVTYQNPHASSDLKLTMKVIENTPTKEIQRNIRVNSRKYPNWLQFQDETGKPAILIGGGASINDHIDEIKALNGTVFALNGASKWARGHGIEVDYQVILDAKEETAQLVDSGANKHLFSSQCNPRTLDKVGNKENGI